MKLTPKQKLTIIKRELERLVTQSECNYTIEKLLSLIKKYL